MNLPRTELTPETDVFAQFTEQYSRREQEELSLRDYLIGCRDEPGYYESAAERMLAAIGEPEVIDTSTDPRLGRIFMNRTIKRYPAFAEFFGMEDTIERIVNYFRFAAQGLEERKQNLDAQIDITTEQVGMRRNLVKKGLDSRVNLLDSERKLTEIRGDLLGVMGEISRTREALHEAEGALARQ